MNAREKLRALHEEISQLPEHEQEDAFDHALRTDPELVAPFLAYLDDPNCLEMVIAALSGETIH